MKVEVYKKPSCPLNIANRGRGPFHRIFSTSSPRHLSVHPLSLVRLHTSNGGSRCTRPTKQRNLRTPPRAHNEEGGSFLRYWSQRKQVI